MDRATGDLHGTVSMSAQFAPYDAEYGTFTSTFGKERVRGISKLILKFLSFVSLLILSCRMERGHS